jgi:diguanylate cyclase (GGDEF)-like protein
VSRGSGLRVRIVAVVLAFALVLSALVLYGALRSAASEANSKLRAQTTLQLARAHVDLGNALSQSSSQLYLSGKLLRPRSRRTHVYVTSLGAPRLLGAGGSYRLERALVVGSSAAPLVRLREQLPVSAALLDGLGRPKVDAGALSVLSRGGVVIAGNPALIGRRLPTGGSVTIAGARYSVGSSTLDTAGSLQVLVPQATIRAQLASTRRKLFAGGGLVLLALVVCLYVLGRPLWRSLGELIEVARADDASTDDLTGLSSQRVFRLALVLEFERWKRGQRPFSLLLLELDDFKQIDDGYGGSAGEEALRSVADVITDALQADGLAARTGRQEFAVLLPDTDLAGAADVAERIRADLEELDVRYGRDIFNVTASVGVAASVVGAAAPQRLLQEAGDALSRAKAAGKNRVELAPPQPATAAGWMANGASATLLDR